MGSHPGMEKFCVLTPLLYTQDPAVHPRLVTSTVGKLHPNTDCKKECAHRTLPFIV